MKCFLCGSANVESLFQGRDLLHGVEGKFELIVCQQCGLAWVNPPLKTEEVDRYYPPGYISFPMAIEDEKNPFRRMDRQLGVGKRARRVTAYAGHPGKLLDIGCATGIFLNAMKYRGWDCYGIEPSTYATEYAARRFDLNIFNGFLEDSQFTDEFFDVITMWDVLEHLPNPVNTLAKVWQMLKPGGSLIISMPNSAAWERYLFNKYWAGWDIPRHFYIYNETTTIQLLSKTGFEVEAISSFTGRHGVLALSVQFWLNDRHLPAWLEKVITSVVRSVPVRLLTYPYYMFADRINKSSIMVVFARKSGKCPNL